MRKEKKNVTHLEIFDHPSNRENLQRKEHKHHKIAPLSDPHKFETKASHCDINWPRLCIYVRKVQKDIIIIVLMNTLFYFM